MSGLPVGPYAIAAPPVRLVRIKNFITHQECAVLNEWALTGVDRGWLAGGWTPRSGVGTNKKRLTTRFYSSRFETPEIVLSIAERIRATVGISGYPLILDQGKDGVVVSCTYDGGDCHFHTDSRAPTTGHLCLRCNIMTQSAENGGVLYVGGQEVDLEAGELHCFLASEHTHGVSVVEGATPRIMWMFGAYVPHGFWE